MLLNFQMLILVKCAHCVMRKRLSELRGLLFLSQEDPLEKRKATQFWPGEFHGLYSPWSRKESDTTE